MDIVSHGLWGAVAFGRKNKTSFWKAFFFGVAPDLFSFGPFFFMVFLGLQPPPQFRFEPPDPNVAIIPPYIHTLYGITHSMLVFLLVFVVAFLIFRKPIVEMLAWGLHILFDIFTHSYNFFPTPFLWPLSDVTLNGVAWGNPWIFFPNIILLIILYAWFFVVKSRRQT